MSVVVRKRSQRESNMRSGGAHGLGILFSLLTAAALTCLLLFASPAISYAADDSVSSAQSAASAASATAEPASSASATGTTQTQTEATAGESGDSSESAKNSAGQTEETSSAPSSSAPQSQERLMASVLFGLAAIALVVCFIVLFRRTNSNISSMDDMFRKDRNQR